MTKSLKGPKGLEEWARRVTEGYPNVCIKDLTHSWRNGLAFCAIIHRFRPDLINFDSLSEKDVYENNRLAFNVAEKHLKVPALLDPEDMAKVQDKCSIALYLSELYQVLEIKRDLRPNLPPSLSS